MKIKTLADVYADQLLDIHSAEAQLIKALPKMAKAATHEDLKQAFTDHLEQTKGHLSVVADLLADIGKKPGRKKCHAMEGLVEEGKEIIEEDAEDEARDAGLIVAAQKVEHYEIATYGSLRTFATLMGMDHHAKKISKVLEEEKKTDVLLTDLATCCVNAQAVQ